MKRKQDDPQNDGDERETPPAPADLSESPPQETATDSSEPIAAEDSIRATDATPAEKVANAEGEDQWAAAPSPRPRRNSSGIIASLALVLALAAVLGVAWLAWQGRSADTGQPDTVSTLASLSDELDEAMESIEDLRDAVADLDESDSEIDRELASLEGQLEDLTESLESIESLPARVADIETTMSSLQGISTGARENWWLAEAEYYMQIANAQLQLAGKPLLASEALRFADERVRQSGNPALTGVRRALSAELQALDAIVELDVAGITLRLASLADAVSTLPIEEDIARAATDTPVIDPDASPLDRTWASLKAAFGDVVSVRRTDEAVQPLLSPDARYFLRANLALHMQTARLAVLRGEQAVFEQSLADAEDWLRQYYDRDSSAVQSALATITDIRNQYSSTDLPDISESLRLLRQYRALPGAGRPADSPVDTAAGNAVDSEVDSAADNTDERDDGSQ